MGNLSCKQKTIEVVKYEQKLEYTLTLTEEQAKLLGTLRRVWVKGGTELYKALVELPAYEDEDRMKVQTSLVDGYALANELRETLVKLEASRLEVARLSAALTASVASGGTQTLPVIGGSWHATAEAEVAPVSKGWKVQYKTYTRGWIDVPANGRDERGNCLASSRNGAYRVMRERSKTFYNPLSSYRVVPYEHAEGEDAPGTRGKYIVELGIKPPYENRRWVLSTYVVGEFASVSEAKIAITNKGARNSKYRVKWVP